MPSTTSTTDSSKYHVPAWKRLGLKLKTASESAHDAALPIVVAPIVQAQFKRKRELEELDSAKVKKTRNISKLSKESSVKASEEAPVTPLLRRQKSVSFTPDTKVEDGDSIKQLFSAWVAEQKASDPSFNTNKVGPAFQIPDPPKVEEHIDPTLDEAERRVKRVKKARRKEEETRVGGSTFGSSEETKRTLKKGKKKGNVTMTAKVSLDPALIYLNQFCTSKDTWKFNKIHQINLLKNAFNLRLIPSENIEQLYVYIAGLKGHARTVLRDAALAVKIKDFEERFEGTMAEPETRQRDYDAVLSEYVTAMAAAEVHPSLGYEEEVLPGLSDYAMKNRMAKRMRAERILVELAADGDTDLSATNSALLATEAENDAAKRAKLNNGKVARKRKQRTTVEVDSSSSEDSSDSESEEESSDNEDEDGAGGSGDEDTSSSSESSSSSGSDSEDGEEDSSEEDSSDSE